MLRRTWRNNGLLPTSEGSDLIAVVREIAGHELIRRASAAEAAAESPRDIFAKLGDV